MRWQEMIAHVPVLTEEKTHKQKKKKKTGTKLQLEQ